MVTVQLWFLLLCVVRVFGGRLEQLEERVMAIQTLTFQDISMLRESVDRNYGEVQRLTEFINTTLSQVIQTAKPVSTTTQDQKDGTWSPEGNEMKSDLIRLKRAFRDQKSSVQALHSELDDKLENLRNDLILQGRETLNKTEGQAKEILEKVMETMDTVSSVWSIATDTIGGITEIQKKLNSTADNITNTIKRALMNTKKLDNLIEASGRFSEECVLKMKQIEDKRKQETEGLKDDIKNTCSVVSNNYQNIIDLLFTLRHSTDIRLIGYSPSSGRLEVFLYGKWGTVCDDGFEINAAKVVCRMLGYRRGEKHGLAYYGRGTGPILLDDVRCTGNEHILFDCEIDYDTSDCGHNEDVGVSCYR
ncbi:uncharacterized protein LOC123532595 [Mercenaria mercenaria]|uniref:uncharacterized protein LOC123532595 n=1 Tax=Mercenaria mercenaria TaxID=6596 RepID=UPI00234EF2A1|nr:uncharacterized protein LOC123532595 [Mercenaria mercenaria]